MQESLHAARRAEEVLTLRERDGQIVFASLRSIHGHAAHRIDVELAVRIGPCLDDGVHRLTSVRVFPSVGGRPHTAQGRRSPREGTSVTTPVLHLTACSAR